MAHFTNADRERVLQGMQGYLDQIKNQSPEESRAFLVKAGIVNSDGTIKEPYRMPEKTNKEIIQEMYHIDSYARMLIDEAKAEGLTYEQTLEKMAIFFCRELRDLEDTISQSLMALRSRTEDIIEDMKSLRD